MKSVNLLHYKIVTQKMTKHNLSFVNCHFVDVTFTEGLHITDKMKPNRARENEQLSQNMPYAFQSILWKCHGHILTVHFWCLIYCNQSMHYKSINVLENQGVSNQIWKICCDLPRFCVTSSDLQWFSRICHDETSWVICEYNQFIQETDHRGNPNKCRVHIFQSNQVLFYIILITIMMGTV